MLEEKEREREKRRVCRVGWRRSGVGACFCDTNTEEVETGGSPGLTNLLAWPS